MNMNNMPKPYKIFCAVVSALYIIYLWSENDISSTLASTPQEQVLPMIITAVLVSTFKLAALAAAILLVKWVAGKIKKK